MMPMPGAKASRKTTLRRRGAMTRREFVRRTAQWGLGLAPLGVAADTWLVEPGWIAIQQVPLRLPRLATAFDGYRLAHISDIHMDGWMTRERLRHVVTLINRQQPDFVAITGDFVSGAAQRHAPDLVAALGALQARDGSGAVLGNHDHWTSAPTVRRAIRDAGVRDLNNDVHTLRRGGAVLRVAGVDDMWVGAGQLETVLEKLPTEDREEEIRREAAVLLAHEPDFADTFAATGRFDLQLSGHSHGGQIRLPFIGPLVLPPHGRKYHTGLHRINSMLQYTNRGVGMIRPHVRFNCRPEITIFTLRADSKILK